MKIKTLVHTNEVEVLTAALESTSCGIIITDARKKENPIIYANQGFIDLTGYSSAEVLGKNCRFLQGDDRNQPELDVLRQAVAARRGCKVTLRNYRKDGSLFWNELVVSQVIDDNGETTHFIGVQNDITQIVQLKQQRDDFVATLVHDLKNPMIACNRILELIIEGTIDAGDQGNLLERIHESNLTMLRMISNTLDYYRCEAGPFQPVFQVFDLSGLCRRVIDEFRLHAKSKSIALQSDYPESLPILGDENLLRRVLVNLIDNAMKFTCKDGRVALIVEHDVNAMIKVVNTGAGLSAEEISTVFDRFVQAKAGKRYSNSSGLGLFFCRQIIEAHGGTIECQSNSGETEFRFTLPISA